MSLRIYMMRYMIGRNDRKRDKGLKYPEDVTRYENIAYGPTKMQVLDVYRPSNIEGKLPVIVSVHGGGWVYGNKKIYRHYCLSLARRGFVVVNFTYRLSPEYKYPAQLEDTAKVFRWVLENAEKYSMDSENVFAVGDSAGAHILSTYCALCINPEYAATYSFATEHLPLPKGVGLNCGVYDMSLIKESADGGTSSLMKDVLPKGGTEEELRWVSPILHIREGFPPSYIMTASGDFVKEHAQPLYDKLQELGVPCTLKVYDDGTNHLGHVFHCDMRNETGRICNDEECEFFKGYLKK